MILLHGGAHDDLSVLTSWTFDPLAAVAIALGARVKRPGDGMTGRPVELSILDQSGDVVLGDYERLLGDAMDGDATLFARQDVVEAAWAIVNPLIQNPGPMFEYEPGSWGPAQADALVADPIEFTGAAVAQTRAVVARVEALAARHPAAAAYVPGSIL